jgi:hypothetical protein
MAGRPKIGSKNERMWHHTAFVLFAAWRRIVICWCIKLLPSNETAVDILRLLCCAYGQTRGGGKQMYKDRGRKLYRTAHNVIFDQNNQFYEVW